MVGAVEDTVRDTKGAPVAASPIQLCGLDACLYGMTDAGGHVLVNANKTLKAPAFKYGDGLLFAKLAAPITMASTVLPSVTTVALPETGVPFLPGGEAVSGGVRLSLPAGGAFVVDDLDYPKPEAQRFRAAALTAAQAAPALDPSLGVAIVYGVAPIGTRFCPPAQVTLPNSEKWPAGTEVEFLIHGLDTAQEDAPYAGWATASSGKVSADGAQIVTDAAGGLRVLSTFGVRQKP